MKHVRQKKIIHEIRCGKFVDQRKWPENKILIQRHNLFFDGLKQHQRMALLKAVRFTSKHDTHYPAYIDTKYSFPNAEEIAILEEAGMQFLKDAEYAKRKLLSLLSELGT